MQVYSVAAGQAAGSTVKAPQTICLWYFANKKTSLLRKRRHQLCGFFKKSRIFFKPALLRLKASTASESSIDEQMYVLRVSLFLCL
jgi:hypothetical protein